MQRRVSIIIIIVLFTGLGALGYWLQQKNKAYIASPFGTIPSDAGIIIEAINMPGLFEEIGNESDITSEMQQIAGLKGFAASIIEIDSLLHTRDLRSIAGSNPVLISFHLIGKERLVPFFALAAPPEIRERHIREFLSGLNSVSFITRDYEKQKIFEITPAGHEQPSLYLSLTRGVIMVSRSQILLEAGVRQSEEPEDITSLPGFRRVSSAAGKNENKVYILFDNFQKIAGVITGGVERGFAGDIPGMASCAELDIYLKKDAITMSGYIQPGDSSDYFARYINSVSADFDAFTVIPSNAALFEAMTGPCRPDAKRGRGTSELTGYLADIIRPQLDDEVTKVYLDIQGQETDENRIVIFRLKGRNATERSFRDEIENNSNKEVDILTYRPDDQSEYTIYKLPDEGLANNLCGSFAGSWGGSYTTFYNNYLITGKTFETISKFIYDNILNRTLANDMTYRSFESTMPSRFTYFLFCIPSRILPLLDGEITGNIIAGFEKNLSSLRKVQAVGYQFVSSNNMIYNTLSLSFRPEVKEEATAQWESLLDTVVYSKPMFFTNHNTGRNEIFVQDLKNNVYLINSAGRILWKLRLREKITGNPAIVDYYRNGKFQILFSTDNFLHLLDRNGNYVERYPVRLRSPASNGMAVFDYEGNKDYRIFICGTDRMVYAYDKTGNVVRGWNQFKTTGVVKKEVEFFRVSGKDFLVVNDPQNMYILDRKGNVRVEIREQVQRAMGSQLRITSGTNPRLVLSSVDGSLKFVSFTGDVETVKLNDFSANHIFEYFDIDADGMGEYIFIDNGTIYCYDNDRSKLFTTKLESVNITGPFGLVFSSNDKKIGFVDSEHGLIHLVDSRGKSVKGFPLRGSTSFSVGRLSAGNTFNLITGGKDSFIYNYEITR